MYRFFQKWCPNIHNALDDDESEDDEMTDPHCFTAEEEVNRVISLFTVIHFSVRLSRSTAYHSVRPFWFQMNRGGGVRVDSSHPQAGHRGL